jgi:UDP-glucuronate 4-epimerase
MTVLVTGGAGFIGSHFCRKLIEMGSRVACMDNFNDYYDPAIKEQNIRDIIRSERFALYRNDILDTHAIEKIFSENDIDLIVHFAARAGVRPSIKNAALYEQVNIKGTLNLLEACRASGITRFIFASSSSVYGGNTKVPFSENDSVDRPVSPYAATKKSGELLCYTYYHLYKINIFCYRFFTVYGPSQRPEMAIHEFTKKIMQGIPINVFGDGSSSRDYTYIEDIINVMSQNLKNIKGYEVFNLGNSRTISLKNLIGLIEGQTGKKAVINRMDVQPGDVFTTYADILKAKKMLKYNPETPIEAGIEKFVKWYKKNLKNAQ